MEKSGKISIFVFGVIILLAGTVSSQMATASTSLQSPTQLIVNYDLTYMQDKIKPGSSGTLIIVIQNTGGLPAKEVKAIIHDTGAIGGGGSWKLGTIDAGQSRTIKTTLRASPDAYSGVHTITLFLDHIAYERDEDGRLDSHDESTNWVIPIRVYGDPNFQITPEKDVFYKDFEEDLLLKGSVMTGAKEVSVTLSTAGSPKCISVIGSEEQYIGDLNKDQEFTINYAIKPANVGICSLSISFEYEDESGNTNTEVVSLGINVKRSDVDFKVVGVSYPALSPGDTAEITVEIKNVGSISAEDVSIDLGLDMEDVSAMSPDIIAGMAAEYPFVMVRTSEAYIDDFGAGETKNAEFKISIDKDADVGSYEIPLKIRYYDGAGVEHKMSKIIGIEVKGDVNLDVGIDESDVSIGKDIGDVTISIVNKGSADVKFLSVRLLSSERYDVLSKEEEYIGKLESDDSDTVTYKIKVKDSGNDVPLSLSIEYMDNYNKEYTENVIVELKLLTDSELGRGVSTLTIIIVFLILAVLGYLIYGKFIKR